MRRRRVFIAMTPQDGVALSVVTAFAHCCGRRALDSHYCSTATGAFGRLKAGPSEEMTVRPCLHGTAQLAANIAGNRHVTLSGNLAFARGVCYAEGHKCGRRRSLIKRLQLKAKASSRRHTNALSRALCLNIIKSIAPTARNIINFAYLILRTCRLSIIYYELRQKERLV